MLCPWCGSHKSKIVTNHGDKANLSIVFKIYDCIYCGTFYECRKCGHRTHTPIESITHVFQCYNYTTTVYHGIIEIGEFNGRKITLHTSNIIREIPYLFLLVIDFKNAFKKLITDSDISDMVFTIIPERKITEFASIIKKSPPSCPFCGRYYETFPSEDIVINHCKSCKI